MCASHAGLVSRRLAFPKKRSMVAIRRRSSLSRAVMPFQPPQRFSLQGARVSLAAVATCELGVAPTFIAAPVEIGSQQAAGAVKGVPLLVVCHPTRVVNGLIKIGARHEVWAGDVREAVVVCAIVGIGIVPAPVQNSLKFSLYIAILK